MSIATKNPHLDTLDQDYLYHLDLTGGILGSDGKDELEAQFGDVKYVCAGGSPKRMKKFAQRVADSFKGTKYELPFGANPTPIGKTDRYLLFKVGPVIICSHGIGQPSMSVLMHEIAKLLKHAKATDLTFFRLGSSGGIGVEPGTVVVCNGGLNGMLQEQYSLPICGEMVHRPAIINQDVVKEALAAVKDQVSFPVVEGKTMSTDCFYEGQARLDGAICTHSEQDKTDFLQKLYDLGARNIEMEAAFFASFTHALGIRATSFCVTLLNRLDGDQVLTPAHMLADFDDRPGTVALKFMHRGLRL